MRRRAPRPAPPPFLPSTNRTSLVPPLVLSGHAPPGPASLTPHYLSKSPDRASTLSLKDRDASPLSVCVCVCVCVCVATQVAFSLSSLMAESRREFRTANGVDRLDRRGLCDRVRPAPATPPVCERNPFQQEHQRRPGPPAARRRSVL
jgi:hypothetical protein